MDKFGISIAILSMTQMGDILYDGTETGRKNVRIGNDFGARLMQQHPKAFGLFGAVPLPDIEGTLKEIEYCFDTLKVDGIGIYTNDNKGRWPGDKYFEPMWQELNRRNAIVFMHPLAPTCCSRLEYGPAASMLEYDFDVTRAVASIVVNGVMFRYPNIRFITVHSGGTVPMLAGRMKDRLPNGAEKYLPNGLYAELRKWYYDIAHASFPWPMAAMMKFMPHDHILFGTDYSPEPIESTVNELPTWDCRMNSCKIWGDVTRSGCSRDSKSSSLPIVVRSPRILACVIHEVDVGDGRRKRSIVRSAPV